MRVVKKPEDRKNELLEIAEKLFRKNEYEKVNVSDIVKGAAVSQGAFYYYFKSKEDIFVTIFNQKINENIDAFHDVLISESLNEIEKLKKIVRIDFEFNRKYDELIKHLHKEENAGLHQKVILAYISNYTPVLTSLIQSGISKGVFKTEYPEETAEFILTIAKFLFDPGFFNFSNHDYKHKILALSYSIEKLLQIPYGQLKLLDDFERYKNA